MRHLVFLFTIGCGTTPAIDQPTGQGETIVSSGAAMTGPFFAMLGTNERTCASCHDQTAGWSITPATLQTLFETTGGMDPVFRSIDATTAPDDDVTSLDARRVAYALLLDRGLIRVGRPLPPGEIALARISDPYGYAGPAELSLFRRPLPATNLRFVGELMWDTREPALEEQAIDATTGHAQAPALADDVAQQIVEFESALVTAQRFDDVAGDLASDGARGGAATLLGQSYEPGINDPKTGFDRDVFTLYGAWTNADPATAAGRRRRAIARGEQIFNTHPFQIRGVAGIANQRGTCSTCHDTPNIGSHSVPLALDLGVSDVDDDTRDLPVYRLVSSVTGQTATTTDPGLALTTGRWADIGKFKVPSLRGLAMRPPYFHNGRARDLSEVVRFYDQKFDLHLSDDETSDLVAFLGAL
ncbi:MAG TPA: hypothetical protein VGC41_11620 [Kofleriaceae bacterium]